jgi:lipopolysaccharide export system protein LptA
VRVLAPTDRAVQFRLTGDALAAQLGATTSVDLDGSASSDPDDPLSYEWTIETESVGAAVSDAVSVADPESANPTVRISPLGLTSDVSVPVRLTVTERDASPVSASDTVTVTLLANAGPADPGPPGTLAYSDENDDGAYQSSEPTYGPNELRKFKDKNVNLVVPSDVDVAPENDKVEMEARKLTIRGTVTSKSNKVSLNADGDVTIDGPVTAEDNKVEITSKTGDVTVRGDVTSETNKVSVRAKKGSVNADGAAITARNNKVEVRGETVSVTDGRIVSETNKIDVRASGGPLDLSGTYLEAPNNKIELRSDGDMILDGAELHTSKQASASLGTDGATLSVAGTVIDDRDDNLAYGPDGVTVDGNPASGSVGGQGNGNSGNGNSGNNGNGNGNSGNNGNGNGNSGGR